MTTPTRTVKHARLMFTGLAAALALLASTAMTKPADAGIFFGFGGPCCGFWPGPYAYYPPPPPYYYAPPPAYYPPPPTAYYPPAAPTASYAPSTASSYAPSTTPSRTATPGAKPAAPASPRITYTDKPAFTNSAGQTCREYKTSDGGHDVFGTACKTADGQWRVVN